jgi:soluble lytic murein transglycosylase-like protein
LHNWQVTSRALSFCLIAIGFGSQVAHAGAQVYEPLTEEVRTVLSGEISNSEPPRVEFSDYKERLAYLDWLGEMSERLKSRQANFLIRKDILETVYYEAKRAGLDPALMLGLIQVESGFHKFAVSSAGARGLTQVMPFWTDLIGDSDRRKLFDMRVNIRFGCVILRHYLDMENGDLFRALGRYNGSLGQSAYPNMVLGAWKHWQYEPQLALPALPGKKSPAT